MGVAMHDVDGGMGVAVGHMSGMNATMFIFPHHMIMVRGVKSGKDHAGI